MRVLVTNDDGIYAAGIAILATFLARAGHDPVVVAPDRERSSVGHAITLTRPLKLQRITGPYPEAVTAHSCDGTPSDCVVLGLEEVAPDISVVFSGINKGPNVGDDLTYSGTVSAAMEGLVLGRTSVAFSLNCQEGDGERHYETAGVFAVHLLQWLADNPLPQGVLLNVNVPNLPLPLIKGVQVTRKGTRAYEGKVNRLQDPHGRTYYWVAGRVADEMIEGTDVWALNHGYISVTPVHLDMTHYPSVEVLCGQGLTEMDLESGGLLSDETEL